MHKNKSQDRKESAWSEWRSPSMMENRLCKRMPANDATKIPLGPLEKSFVYQEFRSKARVMVRTGQAMDRPVASTVSGSLLKIQILQPQSRPTESETRG